MFKIINNFLVDLLNNIISGLAEAMGSSMINWMDAAFFIEKQNWGSFLTAERITAAFWIIYGIAALLLVLKFIEKGFMVYVLWREGDADNDPGGMMVGAVVALVAAIAFPALYQIFADTVLFLGNQVMTVFASADYLESSTFLDALWALQNGQFIVLIEIIVLVITWVILLFKMMTRSVEMLVFRLGVPLAAIGLVNSDGGTFNGYMQLLFKQAVYMLVQTVLAALGVAVSASNIIGSIVILICAVKAPKFLAQFFPPTGGGAGGLAQLALSAWRLKRGGV